MDAPALLRAWRGPRSYVRASRVLDCDPSYLFLIETRQRRPRARFRKLLEDVARIPAALWDDVAIGGTVGKKSTPVNDSSGKRRASKARPKNRAARASGAVAVPR